MTTKKTTVIALKPESQELLDNLNNKDKLEFDFAKKQINKIKRIQKNIKDIHCQYRTLLYQNLQDLYEAYIEISNSPYSQKIFESFRAEVINSGYKLQSNSTNEGLLIRYVWADLEISPKNVHSYGTALSEGKRIDIKPKQFANWLSKVTLTKVVESSSRFGDSKERLNRARVVVLRWLEIKEQNFYAKFPMRAWDAEKQLSEGTNVCVMLGTALRRMDRESGLGLADIYVTTILPPNLDIDRYVIDRFAKHIVNVVERFENGMDKLEANKWAEDIENFLGEEEAYEANKAKLARLNRIANNKEINL